MARLLVTPVIPGMEPKIFEGRLTSKHTDDGLTYYIAGESFPAEIVTVLEDEEEIA